MSHQLATVIGQGVRERRKRLGLSQTTLAARAATTPHAVVSIEGGKRVPTIPVLMRIAGVLDLTLDDLCYQPDNA